MDWLIMVLIVQGFFSMGVTSISHVLPADTVDYVSFLTSSNANININGTTSFVQSKVTQQIKSPIIEIGALVFYSGNVIADLILNFIFAVPEMITLIFYLLVNIFQLDSFMMNQIQIFLGSITFIIYLLGIIRMLANLRSGAPI